MAIDMWPSGFRKNVFSSIVMRVIVLEKNCLDGQYAFIYFGPFPLTTINLSCQTSTAINK